LMMARGTLRQTLGLRELVRALLPFLIAQWTVLAAVLLFPQLVHLGENAGEASRTPATPMSDQELQRRLDQMLPPPPEFEPPGR
jgi:hypothetical protein